MKHGLKGGRFADIKLLLKHVKKLLDDERYQNAKTVIENAMKKYGH